MNIDDMKIINFELEQINKAFEEEFKKIQEDIQNKEQKKALEKMSRNNSCGINRLDDYMLIPNYFIRRKADEGNNIKNANIKILSKEESIKKQADYLTEMINKYYKEQEEDNNMDKEKDYKEYILAGANFDGETIRKIQKDLFEQEMKGANVVSDNKKRENNNIRKFRLIVNEEVGFNTIEYIVLYNMNNNNQKYKSIKDIVTELNNRKGEYINFKLEGDKEIIIRERNIVRLEEI